MFRRTPLNRGRAYRSRPLRREAMSAEVREAVYERSGGRCERCRTFLQFERWECHHRKLRSREGSKGRAGDTLPNLLALCPRCHALTHSSPGYSEALGFVVPSWASPARWPVALSRDSPALGVWGVPDELGGWSLVAGPVAYQLSILQTITPDTRPVWSPPDDDRPRP